MAPETPPQPSEPERCSECNRVKGSVGDLDNYTDGEQNCWVGTKWDEGASDRAAFQARTITRQRQHEAFAPPHPLTALVVCVQEEVGELAGAVLGVTGEKARKAHKTREDVLDAVADAMTYLSLVAGSVGCTDLEGLLADTFNMVSERAGSKITVER